MLDHEVEAGRVGLRQREEVLQAPEDKDFNETIKKNELAAIAKGVAQFLEKVGVKP